MIDLLSLTAFDARMLSIMQLRLQIRETSSFCSLNLIIRLSETLAEFLKGLLIKDW